jgi:transketolase
MMAGMSMREGFGRALAEYGATNRNVVVLDADTSSSTMSKFFAEDFPQRFVNIGIAEPCMVDVAVGFALAGKIPFANAFAALISLRALEQVRTCICYAHTNVKLAAGYAGVSDYKDGPTHHSIVDLAVMRSLPDMTVIVPADTVEAAKWVPVIAEFDGPVYLRLSRAATISVHEENLEPSIGKAIKLRDGGDVALIANGAMVGRSLQAADKLLEDGISAQVIEVHTLKPLDVEMIIEAAESTHGIVTAEEHSVIGGLGGAVAETLSSMSITRIERVGIPDTFTRTAPNPESIMNAIGLSIKDIMNAAYRALNKKGESVMVPGSLRAPG